MIIITIAVITHGGGVDEKNNYGFTLLVITITKLQLFLIGNITYTGDRQNATVHNKELFAEQFFFCNNSFSRKYDSVAE